MSGGNASAVRARHGMAATSHPLATDAALATLDRGGTACDAAVAAAAVLCVCEPMSTGVGGDAFALVWHDGEVTGLNASGRSPRSLDPSTVERIVPYGPTSVTVPGAVSGWVALLERYGRLGLDTCLAPAIDIAEQGFAATPVIARAWQGLAPAIAADPELARVYLPAPAAGDRVVNPTMATVLRAIADHGWEAISLGWVAEAICAATPLDPDDLRDHRCEWVEPLRLRYRDVDIIELPPNGWGAAALQALGILSGFDVASLGAADRSHVMAEALKLAFADAARYVGDTPLPDGYLEPTYLRDRGATIRMTVAGHPHAGQLPSGGTVYLCVVDADGQACSFIQSTYHGFGSRVGAPGTGIALQNRGAGFTLEPGHPNALGPGKRPFHTIIPGMLLQAGELLGPFGVMGGHMQAQGHLQVVSSLVDLGMDPQQALNAPRLRLDPTAGDWALALEAGLWDVADDLAARGHRVVRDGDPAGYGGGQIIIRASDGWLVGGSDPRKDGYAAGR